ncbi:MAG TPA: metallopeptidase TldD-related protein [Burkholderiaceae bacterium]|nr:metallopeptidase TldD-related protein [Burkholderiaceae bacterium]
MSAATASAANDLSASAEQALALMRRQGFEHAQVSVSRHHRHELCVAHNEGSLLRSVQSNKLQLTGLFDGRRADIEGSELDTDGIQALVQSLWSNVAAAPQDAANAVSAAQSARVTRGPQQADTAALADAMHELLDWRAQHTPSVMLEEALAGHSQVRSCTLTSGGSALHCALGWYDAGAFGMAREGTRSSSFNFGGGNADSLAGVPIVHRFGLEGMLRAMTRSVHTEPVGERFTGAVVLTPSAVGGLLGWFLGQLSDSVLIAGSSVYRQALGQRVASPLITLASRFDAPGVSPFSADAFVLAPVTLLDRGTLTCFTPSLYGSRKTGLAHVPVVESGWDIAAGNTPLDTLIAGVARGALVDRLSMGRPAANGDFSGVIKNSFAIRDGEVGHALSETMIAGNVAQMLRDVSAVSAQRIDVGAWVLPWLRVEGLHFS